MKGARPLSNSEILLVSLEFTGTYAIRNRSLFMLGVSVGGRIPQHLAVKSTGQIDKKDRASDEARTATETP